MTAKWSSEDEAAAVEWIEEHGWDFVTVRGLLLAGREATGAPCYLLRKWAIAAGLDLPDLIAHPRDLRKRTPSPQAWAEAWLEDVENIAGEVCDVADAAARLGISRSSLRRRLLQVDRADLLARMRLRGAA